MSIYTACDENGILGVGTSAKKVVALAFAATGKKDDLTSDKFESKFPEIKRTLNDTGQFLIAGKGKKITIDFFPTGNRHADDVLAERYNLRAVKSGSGFKPIQKKTKKSVSALAS